MHAKRDDDKKPPQPAEPERRPVSSADGLAFCWGSALAGAARGG